MLHHNHAALTDNVACVPVTEMASVADTEPAALDAVMVYDALTLLAVGVPRISPEYESTYRPVGSDGLTVIAAMG